MSEEDLRRSYDDAETTEACPAQVLGHNAGIIYYIAASGQMRGVSASQHTEAQVEFLFGGDVGWLETAFPLTDEQRKRSRVGYNLADVRAWLFQEAHKAGIIDPDRDVRGPGVWRDDRGGLIVHCGDKVLIDSAWRAAGFKDGVMIYPAARPEPRPAPEPCPARAAGELLGFLDSWNWRSPPSPAGSLAGRLWLGWAASAYVAGALQYRPHILISGPRGTGKNALNDLIQALFGSSLLRAASPSEAGIRDALAGAARPVTVNEVEHDAHNNRAQQLVELARLGSSEGEGLIYRSSPEGRARSTVIRACFYFSAILYPVMKEQDLSRFTVLDLAPLETVDEESAERVRAGIAGFAEMAPGLRARMIYGFDRLLLNLDVFRQALIAEGADSRQCDQFGTLLAAAETLLSDEAATAGHAELLAGTLMPSQLVPSEDEADHVQAAYHLQTFPIEVVDFDRTRERQPIGELIAEELKASNGFMKKVLQNHGLAIKAEDGVKYLVIANQHHGLDQIFHGTRWRNRVWAQAFARFPGATKSAKAVYFGGVTAKGTWVPVGSLPPLSDPDK